VSEVEIILSLKKMRKTKMDRKRIHIGQYVIFVSRREYFDGRALGKIIAHNENRITISRIDNPEDTSNYSRDFTFFDVAILDTKDEFLARLQF
jgi:hypothetical protein